jgi:hypothetical protein
MCVGLLVLMLAVIPTDCLRPPERWREWNERHRATNSLTRSTSAIERT